MTHPVTDEVAMKINSQASVLIVKFIEASKFIIFNLKKGQ